MSIFNGPEVQNILNALNTHLEWTSLNGPPRTNFEYHPSSFGKCSRQQQYMRYAEMGYIKHTKEIIEPVKFRLFDTRTFYAFKMGKIF